MKYIIDIEGMHCSGCQNSIKMIFNDLGFTDIEVILEKNNAQFKSEKTIEEIKIELKKTFEKDLKSYKYSKLVSI